MHAEEFIQLHNVVVADPKSLERYRRNYGPLRFHGLTQEEVLTTLVRAHPEWTFQVLSFMRYGVSDVKIYAGPDYLGEIEAHRRGDSYGVRMNPAGAVLPGKFSSVTKAAISYINKNFAVPTPETRIKQAATAARHVLERQRSDKRSRYEKADKAVEKDLRDFVLSTPIYEQYLWYCRTPEGAAYAQNREAHQHATMEMSVVDDMYDAACVGEGVLLLCFKDEYIVRTRVNGIDTVNIYNDTNLPYELRAKLGMLKLIDDTQLIKNCGCRINAQTYFIANGDLYAEGDSTTG